MCYLTKYKDLTPQARVFWLFLSQVLEKDCSCRESLRKFQAELFRESGRRSSPSTAAYCKARLKLRPGEVRRISGGIAGRMNKACPWSWYGRQVKVVDGTGVSMPDSPANKRAWPLSGKSRPGCWFPVMRMVAIFSLATGALMELAHGPLGVHERTLCRSLWSILERGDVLLGDRGFCGFADFFLLKSKGVDCVMRKHGRRINAGVIRKINKRDRIVEWRKTGVIPKWLDRSEWEAIPEAMAVREVEVTVMNPGFRTRKVFVVTTLLDEKLYPAGSISELYRKRWRVELYFRDIKTTMAMDVLKCKTPEMIETELWMKVVAYNLIRAIMMQAALKNGAPIEKLSFKGTVSTILSWNIYRGVYNKGSNLLDTFCAMLDYIAQDLVPDRPDRIEPRARKRRPKNYQLLNKPRHLFHEISHRNRHKKGLS
ncbi:MAG TPA: IS4 family transposase [Acidobacteriota bacterium]|nr:IS4 family transposase [Acidobacteriota bacterium]